MATSTYFGWAEPDDTDLVKNGASAMRTLGNAIDSTVYTTNYFAGKNKIINGDFGIWQRGTSFSTATYFNYYADRWGGGTDGTGVTRTVSQQTFTPATAPVSGYEGTYFLRVNQSVAGTGATFNVLDQRIEDVRTFAGKTITFSFWAKAAATTSLVKIEALQNFGSGGSTEVATTLSTAPSIGTSWTRYTYTITLPTLSGKTIGTSSYLAIRFLLPINATFTFDIWGVQLEAGSTATPFQTATGTNQGELAASQRYYQRTNTTYIRQYNATGALCNQFVLLGTSMRTTPTATVVTAPGYNNASAFGVSATNANTISLNFTVTTTGTGFIDQTGVFELTAEL